MNVIRRMLAVREERLRRWYTDDPPQFAMGVAPSRPNPAPRVHPCKKAPTTPPPLKPLLTFAANIPYDCMVHVLMAGIRIKDRHEAHQLHRATIEKIHPPEMRIALLQSLYEKEYWCMLESKCRTAFRILVSKWLFKRYSANNLNTEDPATLSDPVYAIRVFDSTARGTYVFEAASLRKSMERDLTYCDWLFPEPFHPKNPLTNLPFHMGHRIYILQQLRSYNQGSWILESYHKTKWNLIAFRDIFLVPLKTRALQDICRNPTSEETIEHMEEFIEDQYEYHQIYRPEILTVLNWAVKNMPTDEYMLEWLQAFKQIYSVQIIYGQHFLEDNIAIQTTLYKVTRQLFRQIKTINRLAKLRNTAIQARRRERVAPLPSAATSETIHGPVSVLSEIRPSALSEVQPSALTEIRPSALSEVQPSVLTEIQPTILPLSNPIIVTSVRLFEFGDITIDALTERISLTIDEWNHANP